MATAAAAPLVTVVPRAVTVLKVLFSDSLDVDHDVGI